MFQRTHLSRVQQFGLELLTFSVNPSNEFSSKDERIRLALLTGNPSHLQRLFPEMISQDEHAKIAEEAIASDGPNELSSDISPVDAMDIIRQMKSGSLDGDFSFTSEIVGS